MKKRITDPVEQLRALLTLGDNDMLDADYPKALIDAELRDAGGDPEQVGAETEAFVKKLMAERAEAESRKASRTRLRSQRKASSSHPRRPRSPPCLRCARSSPPTPGRSTTESEHVTATEPRHASCARAFMTAPSGKKS